jgi:hypothetical protein
VWTGLILWGGGGYSELPGDLGRRPTLYKPTDLTGDGVAELVWSAERCGAHTCFQIPRVLSAHGAERVRPILASHGSSMVQKVEIKSPNKARAYLEFTSGWVGSAGAGQHQRGVVEKWKWNTKSGLIEAVPATKGGVRLDGESENMMDRFGDALFALESQDKRAAWKAFEDVLRNDDLPVGEDGETGEKLRPQLRQLAFYELARIAIEAEDDKTLASVQKRLARRFPDAPTHKAIDALEKRYKTSGSMAMACRDIDEPLFEGRWALMAHGYNPQFRPRSDFGRKGLCAGLRKPPTSSKPEASVVGNGHLRVSFEVTPNGYDSVDVAAQACAKGCTDACKPAKLTAPASQPFESVSAGKAPQRDYVVWRVDCERAEDDAGLSLCLRATKPDEHLLGEVPVEGDMARACE